MGRKESYQTNKKSYVVLATTIFIQKLVQCGIVLVLIKTRIPRVASLYRTFLIIRFESSIMALETSFTIQCLVDNLNTYFTSLMDDMLLMYQRKTNNFFSGVTLLKKKDYVLSTILSQQSSLYLFQNVRVVD